MGMDPQTLRHSGNELKGRRQWSQGPFPKMYEGALESRCWRVLFFLLFPSSLACGRERGGEGGCESLHRRAGCQARCCSTVLNILITLRVKEPCGACSGVRVKNEPRHRAWPGGGCLPAASASLQCLPLTQTRPDGLQGCWPASCFRLCVQHYFPLHLNKRFHRSGSQCRGLELLVSSALGFLPRFGSHL